MVPQGCEGDRYACCAEHGRDAATCVVRIKFQIILQAGERSTGTLLGWSVEEVQLTLKHEPSRHAPG